MPNHCYNKLKVTGPAEDLARFQDAAVENRDEDPSPISFQSLRPMPNVFKDIHTGSTTDSNGVQCRQWREIDGKSVAVLEAELLDLKSKYGAANWYDWAICFWGTKWDAYDSPTLRVQKNGALIYKFTTAWSPPNVLLEYLSGQYPTLTFVNVWKEEGGQKGRDYFGP